MAAREGLPWHEAETLHFGLDHGLIGAMVLKSWNLPETLTEPVNWHHAPEAAPGRREPGYVINCADACVRTLTGDQTAGIDLSDTVTAAIGLTMDAALAAVEAALATRNPALFAATLA